MFVQVVENTYILMGNALFVLLVDGGIIIHKKGGDICHRVTH